MSLQQMQTTNQRIDALNSRIDAMISKSQVKKQLAQSFPGQQIGDQIVSTEGVEFQVHPRMRNSGNIVISADGPFFARAIHIAARIYSEPNKFTYPWFPISAGRMEWTDENIYKFDFYFEYEVSGSKRKRQNRPVPSGMFTKANYGCGGFKLPCEDIFPPLATVTIWITSTVRAPEDVTNLIINFYAGFSGAYMSE